MKKMHLKPWQLYASMFILLFAIGVFMRWCDPRGAVDGQFAAKCAWIAYACHRLCYW